MVNSPLIRSYLFIGGGSFGGGTLGSHDFNHWKSRLNRQFGEYVEPLAAIKKHNWVNFR